MRNTDEQTATQLIFDRAGIRETDVRAIEHYGMTGLALMEKAARGSVEIALEMIEKSTTSSPVVIACGPGNNGGDGFAMARHLSTLGVPVSLLTAGKPDPGSDAEVNALLAARMGLESVSDPEAIDSTCLIVDALLGTGLNREVTGHEHRLIEAINASSAPVLSIDVPSGLDTDTGKPLGIAVMATETVTFVGLKIGFLEPEGRVHTGRVRIIDIGIPPMLARSLALNCPNNGASSNTEL